MPALQVTYSSLPSIVDRLADLAVMRCMARKMTSSFDWSFRISTNSSPPRRATVSPSRSTTRRRSAMRLEQLVAGASGRGSR